MKELQVTFNHLKENCFVGTLAQRDKQIFFQYDPSFLQKNIPLSPYSLPQQKELLQFEHYKFSDMFGAFADSLPDGWGLLLMDRYLSTQKMEYQNLSSFDRLAFMGNRAMGALAYHPTTHTEEKLNSHINLLECGNKAIKIYEGSSVELIEKLIIDGGSPGGARPKIAFCENQNGVFTSEGNQDKTAKHWIVKFDVSRDFKDFSTVEYLYSLMAKNCGIEMPETKLFKDRKNNRYFGIERFDRLGDQRIHTHTFGSLIESNYRIPAQDYSDLLLVTHDLTKNMEEVEKAFRLMIFNHLTHNRDDHVKNFSFIMNDKFRWQFSPAYDLTPSTGPGGEHSMTINQKGDNISMDDYHALGNKCGIKKRKVEIIFDEVKQGISSYKTLADQAEVTSNDLRKIESYLRS